MPHMLYTAQHMISFRWRRTGRSLNYSYVPIFHYYMHFDIITLSYAHGRS